MYKQAKHGDIQETQLEERAEEENNESLGIERAITKGDHEAHQAYSH